MSRPLSSLSRPSRPSRSWPVLGLLVALFLLLPAPAAAYTRLSASFLGAVPAVSDADLDAVAAGRGRLADVFRADLPAWTQHLENITVGGKPLQHLVLRREPPWTGPGQSNLLTLGCRASSSAASSAPTSLSPDCALLLHVARTIEPLAAQMYAEMQELGEGGTVPMDMGVQLVVLDGPPDNGLAAAWEKTANPALPASSYGYPNRLNQISLLLFMDGLGRSAAPAAVSSRYPTTHWAYRAAAAVERRLREAQLIGLPPAGTSGYLPDTQSPVRQQTLGAAASNSFSKSESAGASEADYHVPFMRRGVTVLPLVPDEPRGASDSGGAGASAGTTDKAVVRDWSRIVTAFVMEWLDMMEVAPQQRRRWQA